MAIAAADAGVHCPPMPSPLQATVPPLDTAPRPLLARLLSRLRAAGLLSLLGLVVCLVLLSTVVQGLVQVERVRERQAWVDLSSQVRREAESLRARLGGAGRELQGAAVREGRFEEAAVGLRQALDEAIARLRESTRDNAAQAARVEALPALVQRRLDTLLAVMRDRGGPTTLMARSDAELRPAVETAAAADRLIGDIVDS